MVKYTLENIDFRDKYKIAFYCSYAFIFLLLVLAAVLSNFEIWPFEVYKRKYAPPGVSPGGNISPFVDK